MDKKPDPLASARSIGRAPPPRRTYKNVTVAPHEDGYALFLDERMAMTPAGNPLAVANVGLATALATEWEAQGERLDPAAMPLSRIANSALDAVADQVETVRADIVRHAGSDLLCYRADGPEDLVARQEVTWSPLLAFASDSLGAKFLLAQGVMHVVQDPRTLGAIDQALAGYDALSLAAIHTVTSLTGSAVIALAVACGHITPEEAWSAAHVDEDWQSSQWGEDDLAREARAFRWREMEAAAVILSA